MKTRRCLHLSATRPPVWDSHQQRFVDASRTDLVDTVLFTHRALAQAGSAAAAPAAWTMGAVQGAVKEAAARHGEAQQAIEQCQLRDLHGPASNCASSWPPSMTRFTQAA